MKKNNMKDKILGCWAGKCLGGAIGMPYEGVPFRPSLTPDNIVVQDVPNDDLEMQLIWITALEEYGLSLDCFKMGQMWKKYINAGCDEYSIAIRNLKHNVNPPVSGWLDNCFADGMGATIRSEVWAAVFAGRPDAAGYFASIDASVDHWGDGVYGEVFMAMLEAKAFETCEIESSIRFAFSKLPSDTRLAEAVGFVLDLYSDKSFAADEVKAGNVIRERFWHHNFTDCVMNLAIICYALLWGRGDFMKSIILAVDMGRDTDCTAASVGSVIGICGGMEVLPKDLLGKLKDELTLSPYVKAVPNVPLSLSETVERTLKLHDRLFPVISDRTFPAYTPYQPTGDEPRICYSEWLVVDSAGHDVEKIKQTLMKTGRCVPGLKDNVIKANQILFDLTGFAHESNTLDLFSFMTVEDAPETTVISATADVGMTLWLDDKRLMNHHSRILALPSFHRAEGGGAFSYPLSNGEKHLVHVRLYSCNKPLRCSVMFGDLSNNHIEGIRLSMPR